MTTTPDRRTIVAGNWKMNKTPDETDAFLDAFTASAPTTPSVEVLLIPPFTSLDRAGRRSAGTRVRLGAQDVHEAESGAFTGAVSGAMLAACGCTYVLVGHSERRHVFGDDDAIVRCKVERALAVGLAPILCVGETLDERRADETEAVLVRQLSQGLAGLSVDALADLVIAYEPVWAIGTGETATPEQAQGAIARIRAWVAAEIEPAFADRLPILYGGSVKPANALDLLSQSDIDGALVGGASLDPDAFADIVRAGISAAEGR